MHLTVRSNVVVNLIRTITITLLSFLTFPYVCRALSAMGLGTYQWAASFVYYFFVLARISVPNIAVRECVAVRDDKSALSQKIHEFFLIQAITTLISFGLLSVLLFSIPQLFEYSSVIFILSLNFLVGLFSFEWVFQALEKHTYLALRSIIIAGIVDILIFSFIKYDQYDSRVELYSFFCVLTTILSVVSNLIYLPFVIKLEKPKKLNLKQYLPTLTILFLISFVSAIYDKTDSFILGFLDSTKSSVGDYSVGLKGVEIVIGIITALSTVFIPRATHYYASKDERQFKNINVYSTNICLFIVIPATAVLFALSKPLTTLISGSYETTVVGFNNTDVILLCLLSLMITFSLSFIIYTQILIPQKREKTYLLAISLAALTNVSLSLIFGMVVFKNNPVIGVSLATSITDALMFVVLLKLTWNDSKKMIFRKNNLKILLVGTLIGILAFVVSPIIQNALLKLIELEIAMLVNVIIILVGSAILYIGGLLLTKETIVSALFLGKQNNYEK